MMQQTNDAADMASADQASTAMAMMLPLSMHA